jgi:hypothetical protein
MSLDRSEVKRIVDEHLEPLMSALGIRHWRIEVDYDRVGGADDGCVGHANCTRLPDYERAGITIDHDEQDDEKHLVYNLRHELLHVVIAPMDILYKSFVFGLEGEEFRKAETLWHHAVEMAVRNLERMCEGQEQHWRKVVASEQEEPPAC